MNRPSRGLRESVATMLKNGRFFAPPRASRITTMTNSLFVLRHPLDSVLALIQASAASGKPVIVSGARMARQATPPGSEAPRRAPLSSDFGVDPLMARFRHKALAALLASLGG